MRTSALLNTPLAGRTPWLCALALLGMIALASSTVSAGALEQVLAMPKTSLAVGYPGKLVISHHASAPMIPASTMKLVTALAAIERWGLAHQFSTELLLDGDQRLWVRGSGDPYLVSEELTLLAQALRRNGLTRIAGLGLDPGLYPPDVRIPGRSGTNNPYDAPITALAVNFNTVNLAVGAKGIRGGEAQTPLTATARRLGAGLGPGQQRVNLGTRSAALDYFGELLAAKLDTAGIQISGATLIGPTPTNARLVLRHTNSRALGEVIASMLEYSNNFVANNLFLMLGAEHGHTDFPQAQRVMEAWARKKFGWRDFRIEDGAGLSRGNRLSANQQIELLVAMTPYRALLPEQDDEPRVRAKTGTLSGVSCYAGYVQRPEGLLPFSLMINEPAPYALRMRLARALAELPRLPRTAGAD